MNKAITLESVQDDDNISLRREAEEDESEMKCRFCGKDPKEFGRGPLGADQTCDPCWEVEVRLGIAEIDAMIIASKGRQYVADLLKKLGDLKS